MNFPTSWYLRKLDGGKKEPKKAVPARRLRLRGARSAAELALAGTFNFESDVVFQLDWRLGANPTLNKWDYTPPPQSVNEIL